MKTIALLLALTSGLALGQGSLTPPGAPAPTMKTLTQIEPRTDLATLPASATAVISITQTGSYYASGNIAGVAGKNTIEVLVSGVTIDLKGYALTGTPSNRSGILALNIAELTVRNGRVTGGTRAIQAGSRLACSDLIVEGGISTGIFGGTDSSVERCRMTNAGIQLDLRGLVMDCQVTSNDGIFVGQGGIVQRCSLANGAMSLGNEVQVSDCSITDSPDFGILAGLRCVIRDCTVNGAGRSGILAGEGTRVSRCAVTRGGIGSPSPSDAGISLGAESFADSCSVKLSSVQGFLGAASVQFTKCTAATNTGAGFSCLSQSHLTDCTATGNTLLGISAGNRSVLTGCIVTTNLAGGLYVTGSGALVERCLVSGNTGGSGIRVDSGMVRECESTQNTGGAGIRVSTGSTVTGNTSSSNGVAATPQNGYLIEGGRSRVEGNHAYNNTGFGLEVTNTSSVNSVLVIGNSAGSNDLGEFSIGAGNAAGPIITPASVGTTTIPTANFNL